MLDGDMMMFSAGNMLQILNMKTNEIKYVRSIAGGGIGAIAVSSHFYIMLYSLIMLSFNIPKLFIEGTLS